MNHTTPISSLTDRGDNPQLVAVLTVLGETFTYPIVAAAITTAAPYDPRLVALFEHDTRLMSALAGLCDAYGETVVAAAIAKLNHPSSTARRLEEGRAS